MQRRTVLQSGLTLIAGGSAGCSSATGGDLVVEDVSSEGSGGVVTLTVTVKNTADGTRRGTVLGELDVTSAQGEQMKREDVEVPAGESATVKFVFLDVVPDGEQKTTYSVDASVGDVYDPDGTADVTRETAADADLGVEVAVTYPADGQSEEPSLSETDYDNVYCPVTERSAVTPFVNFFLWDNARKVTVTFTYEESAIPDDGEASELTVMQFKRQSQQFEALEDSTVDSDAHTVSGSLYHSGIVDVVVFHEPTWRREIEGQEDASITTICRS